MSEEYPRSLLRLRFIIRYDNKKECRICSDQIYFGQSAIKIKIPQHIADRAGFLSPCCPKAKEKLFYQHGLYRGYLIYVFHWCCYRDWEFRLDKTKAAILPEFTRSEREEKNKAMGRERGYFSEGMRLLKPDEECP